MSKSNIRTKTGKVAKAAMFLPLAILLMGNDQCSQGGEEVAKRELRRRVQMGAIEAPSMAFSDGGTFDFKYAANAQMYTVLRNTNSFSTSTISPTAGLDPSTMTEAEKQAFYQCEDTAGNSAFQMSQEAACMVHMPHARINGDITNFQVTSSTGLTLDLFKLIGFSGAFKSTKANLSMSFDAVDPLIPGHVHASSSPTAKSQEFAMNATINFGEFGLGPSYYSKSDLSQVVAKAMTAGISDLKSQFDKGEPWFAMVLKNCDKAIMINAGNYSDAGLEVGDVLEVYNTWYDWSGDVCASTLMGAMKASKTPIAVVQVEIVGNTFSQARVVEQTAEKILPGARVYVRKLMDKQAAK